MLQIQNATHEIGRIEIRIAVGDIAEADADACVVPQFRNCVSEGGVAAALGRAGAHLGVDAEYEAFLSRCVVAPEFGDVHLSPSHGGRVQKLFHAVTVASGEEKEYGVVGRAVRNVLAMATAAKIRSIVFPVLGTGIIGDLTDEQSALSMFSSVAAFAARDPDAELSLLVVVYHGGPDPVATVATLDAVLASKAYLEATPTVGQREADIGRWAREMQRDLTLGRMPADPAEETGYGARKDDVPAAAKEKSRGKTPSSVIVAIEETDQPGPSGPRR